MKLQLLSDLHLNVTGMPVPRTAADVVVLAGDIARPANAIEWARQFEQPVLYVPGNHEFYGSSIAGTIGELRKLARHSNIHVLSADATMVDGVRFLGATLWTDFELYPEAERRAEAVASALRYVRDFTRITKDSTGEPFTPQMSIELHRRERAWLEAQLAQPFDGSTVVITHHAPSRGSIHSRFAGSPVNPAFVSDAEALMDGRYAALWLHGHTHDSFDYRINGTRVVCNPRGYAKNGINENALFDPLLTLEVG
ncbi:MAG TPA: metallophosphoesterase family protein [Burkholderiales bacterium]|nr:metallophosphoesterase family protein [Burkholderiales bacterium]